MRTLLIAGYSIEGVHRQPTHAELSCTRVDVLGTTVRYLLCITEEATLSPEVMGSASVAAKHRDQIPVFVTSEPGDGIVSWDELDEAFGGAVPTWQALTDDYDDHLLTLSTNSLPEGASGEAWLLFEDAAAAGLAPAWIGEALL